MLLRSKMGWDQRDIDNLGIVGAAFPTHTTGAANTYGTITELITAANNVQDSYGITVMVQETAASATISGTALDILIGGATDDVLISSLLVGWVFGGPARSYFFPVFIPAGVRVACQAACETASKVMGVGVILHGGGSPPWPVGSKVTTYGSKNNSARGQTVTPGASGAAATVTQLAASTSEDHFYLVPGFEPYNDTTIAQNNHSIGIGVGAATEERIGTWQFSFDAGEKGVGPLPVQGVWRHVPSGTRLSMLASTSGGLDATYGGLIYAVS